jgi:hypothetical protein
MRRYLLDTGAASDVINRRHGAHDMAYAASQQGDVIGLATPVLGELIAGIEGQRVTGAKSHKVVARYPTSAAVEF